MDSCSCKQLRYSCYSFIFFEAERVSPARKRHSSALEKDTQRLDQQQQTALGSSTQHFSTVQPHQLDQRLDAAEHLVSEIKGESGRLRRAMAIYWHSATDPPTPDADQGLVSPSQVLFFSLASYVTHHMTTKPHSPGCEKNLRSVTPQPLTD